MRRSRRTGDTARPIALPSWIQAWSTYVISCARHGLHLTSLIFSDVRACSRAYTRAGACHVAGTLHPPSHVYSRASIFTYLLAHLLGYLPTYLPSYLLSHPQVRAARLAPRLLEHPEQLCLHVQQPPLLQRTGHILYGTMNEFIQSSRFY